MMFNLFLQKYYGIYTRRIGYSVENDTIFNLNVRLGRMYKLTDAVNLKANIIKEKTKGDSVDLVIQTILLALDIIGHDPHYKKIKKIFSHKKTPQSGYPTFGV